MSVAPFPEEEKNHHVHSCPRVYRWGLFVLRAGTHIIHERIGDLHKTGHNSASDDGQNLNRFTEYYCRLGVFLFFSLYTNRDWMYLIVQPRNKEQQRPCHLDSIQSRPRRRITRRGRKWYSATRKKRNPPPCWTSVA